MPSAFCSALQLFLHVLAQLQVERAERLVEQQHLGLVDQRAGERHALALAAGKLARPARAVAGQPHQLERLLGGLAPLGLADALDHQPVGDVVEHVQMREQRIVLEDGVDVAPIGRNALGASRRKSRYGRQSAARSRRSGAGRSSCPSRTARAWRRTRPARCRGRRRRRPARCRNGARPSGRRRLRSWCHCQRSMQALRCPSSACRHLLPVDGEKGLGRTLATPLCPSSRAEAAPAEGRRCRMRRGAS